MIFSRKIFFVLFLFCIANKVSSQSTFLKTYGSNESEYGTSLCLSDDGGFVVASILPDVAGDIRTVLYKTDRDGVQEWVKSYGSSAKNVPTKVINSNEGGYYLLFSSWTIFNPANFYSVLLKTDSLGNELWSKNLSVTQSDLSIDIELEDDHLYIIATSTYNTGGYPGVLVHKLDTSGSLIWSNSYTFNYQFKPVSAALDGHGRLGILGATNGYGIGTPTNDNNFLLLLDSAGEILSTAITGVEFSDEPNSLVWQNGTWVFSTLIYTWTGDYHISIQRFDSTGVFLESKEYDATIPLYHWEVARDILPLSDGSIIITGDIGSFDERNVMLAKINPLGFVDWAVQYPVSPLFTNYSFQVIGTSDGGYAFTGDMRPPTAFRNAFIIKTDSLGLIPCHTAPVHFNVLGGTVELEYVSIFKNEVFPTLTSPSLNADIPFYPEVVVCENIPPQAFFTSSLDSLCPQTCFKFINQSTSLIDTWEWTFGGGIPASYSGPIPPLVCFSEPGVHTVSLYVTNSDGVSTYNSQAIVSKVKCDTLFIPNVITPNGDGKNDRFAIKGLPDNFNLQIYNRWGKLLYETQNKNSLWDPKDVSQGVYYYLLKVITQEGNDHYRGSVSVLSE